MVLGPYSALRGPYMVTYVAPLPVRTYIQVLLTWLSCPDIRVDRHIDGPVVNFYQEGADQEP